jgi:hypothetical protein
MSWRWSRLSTLTVVALLYAAPLSSGDKGLWLSVASLPVPLFGAIPGGMAAEHTITLPNRGALSLARACVERGDPALGPGLVAVDDPTVDAAWTSVSHPPSWSAPDGVCPLPTAPRGPPA